MRLREQGGNAVAIYNLKTRGSYAPAVPEGSPIRSLKDMKGKVLGVASLATGALPIINESLKEASLTKVDALGLWDSAYGAIENTGLKMTYIELPLIDKLASFALATSDSFIKSNPAAVEAYCRAVAKGWVFTLANPEAAIRAMAANYK